MPEDRENLPKVSILISTKNRRNDLQLAINSIKNINYPQTHFEIVVVEETDKPRPLKGVKYVSIPEENKGFGYIRNVAVKNASHSIVAFTDDDCQVQEDWLKELVAPIGQGVAAVAGAVLVRNCGILGYCENALGFPGGGIKYIHRSGNKTQLTNRLSTCNSAFLKDIIISSGNFSHDTPFGGEDFLLAEKIAERYTCYYQPRAIVYHKPRESLWAIFKWFVRRGRSAMSIIKLSSNKRAHIIWNIYTSIILRFIILLIVLFILKLNILIWLPILFFAYYLFTIVRYRYAIHYYKNYKILLLIPIVKLMMDFGMDCGRLLQLLKELIT